MWKDIEKPWQEAFGAAWEAYKRGTIPIGSIIVNQNGEIVSKGRNRIFDDKSQNPLAGSNMAHAEMTAMLDLRGTEHPDIKKYILYTTMEPCPMCFGTMVMMGIRNIRFAARDGFAGATSLNDKLAYIKSKEIDIKAGRDEMEAFQLVLQSAYEYSRQHPRIEAILETWREINKSSVDYGKKLNEEKYFERAAEENKGIEHIYDEVIEGFLEFKKEKSQIQLKIPEFHELNYRRKLLADTETMTYNIGYGKAPGTGCIDFNEKAWEAWFSSWVNNIPERYYAYIIKSDENIPVGEVALRYVKEKSSYCVNIIIDAKYRGNGFSEQALKLLVHVGFNELGAERIFDDFKNSRVSAEKVFKKVGFKRISEDIVELTRADYLK